MILAIDPGNIESAYVVLDENLKPIAFEKCENEGIYDAMGMIFKRYQNITHVAIEMLACYGMPVGKEVFDTCVWIGRFYERIKRVDKGLNLKDIRYIYRKDEKMNLCNSMKAKDSNIIQALKDRFGEKGTKNNPGWFYGFKKDVWQAYAVGVTYHDLYLNK